MTDPLTLSLAAAVREGRLARGLSTSALATRAGVSRAMITKVERAESQPTAALLGRLSAGLGMTLSELVATAEQDGGRLARAADQPTWTDPVSGYRRRAVSPRAGGPLELVEVDFPAGSEVSFPADTYAFIHQQVWVLAGRLHFVEGDVEHVLDAGDCLELGAPITCTFRNPTPDPCRYLVAITQRSSVRVVPPGHRARTS